MRTTIAIASPRQGDMDALRRQGYRGIRQFDPYLGKESSVCFAKSL